MDEDKKPALILASASPRRIELLTLLHIEFTVKAADISEEAFGNPEDQVIQIAKQKAQAVLAQNPDSIILSADTLVQSGEHTLGKPRDAQDATQMLKLLSGSWHQVYTGICLIDGKNNKKQTAIEKTDVLFSVLTDQLINAYIKTGEPMDKAGAYAIQGQGGMFIEEIRGSYSNVIGLPLALTRKMLAAFDINPFETDRHNKN